MIETPRNMHWQDVWANKAEEAVSWYQAHPGRSLDMIARAELPSDAPIIDVGGGASLLVDHLLDAGHTDVSVLDLADAGLRRARQRLGARADMVHWYTRDVLGFNDDRTYALWHDRAVFHFLTDPSDRARYLETLLDQLAPQGQVVIATFAADGPERCSGLPVQRYSPQSLHEALGTQTFDVLESDSESHYTPWDSEQRFTWLRLRRR